VTYTDLASNRLRTVITETPKGPRRVAVEIFKGKKWTPLGS
jgi:hypothetical protein